MNGAMTAVQQFLLDYHPEYGQLSEEERRSLADFCLLWSVFEGAMLGPGYTHATVRQIPETLDALGVLQKEKLAAEIAHVKQRYYRDGSFTPEFDGRRGNWTTLENRTLVREFLTAGPAYPVVKALKALLLLILHLRKTVFTETQAMLGYREHIVTFEVISRVLKFILAHHPWRH